MNIMREIGSAPAGFNYEEDIYITDKMKEFLHTEKFINKPYTKNNPTRRVLKHGDDVLVYPRNKYEPTPYKAKVLFLWVKWAENPCVEVCTYVYGKWHCVMNDYLFNRIEPI